MTLVGGVSLGSLVVDLPLDRARGLIGHLLDSNMYFLSQMELVSLR